MHPEAWPYGGSGRLEGVNVNTEELGDLGLNSFQENAIVEFLMTLSKRSGISEKILKIISNKFDSIPKEAGNRWGRPGIGLKSGLACRPSCFSGILAKNLKTCQVSKYPNFWRFSLISSEPDRYIAT